MSSSREDKERQKELDAVYKRRELKEQEDLAKYRLRQNIYDLETSLGFLKNKAHTAPADKLKDINKQKKNLIKEIIDGKLKLNAPEGVLLKKKGGLFAEYKNIDEKQAIEIFNVLWKSLSPHSGEACFTVPLQTIKKLGDNLEEILKNSANSTHVMNVLLDVKRNVESYKNSGKFFLETDKRLAMARALDEHIFQKYRFELTPFQHIDYAPGRKDIQRLSVTFPGNRLTRTPAHAFTSDKDVLAEHARDRIANHENIIRNILQTAVIAQHSPTPQAAPLSITEEDAFITLLYLEDKTMQTVRQLGYQPGKIALDFRNCPEDITANLRLWGQQQSHNILTGKYTGQLQQNIAKEFRIVMDSASAPKRDPLEVEEKSGSEATPQPSAPTYPDIPPPYRAPTPPPDYYATPQATFTAVVKSASSRVPPPLPPKPEAWTERAAQPESGCFTPPPK